MAITTDNRLDGQRKVTSRKRGYSRTVYVSSINRVVIKFHSLIEAKGLEFVEELIDSASGTSILSNPAISNNAPYLFLTIIADVIELDTPNINFPKNRRGWKYSQKESTIFSLFAMLYSTYVGRDYRSTMQSIFNISRSTCYQYKNYNFAFQTTKFEITEPYSKTLCQIAKCTEKPHHLYVVGKEIFLEELVDMLAYAVINYCNFKTLEQESIKVYYDRIIGKMDTVKAQLEKTNNSK